MRCIAQRSSAPNPWLHFWTRCLFRGPLSRLRPSSEALFRSYRPADSIGYTVLLKIGPSAPQASLESSSRRPATPAASTIDGVEHEARNQDGLYLNAATSAGVPTAPFLEALESENANGRLVMVEFMRACRNVPLEASVQEAAVACSAPVRQLAAVLQQVDVRARDIRL